MGRRWLLILVLASLTVIFSIQTAQTWLKPFQAHTGDTTAVRTHQPAAPKIPKQVTRPKSAYEVIAVKNLFRPNRTEGETQSRSTAANLNSPAASRSIKQIGLFGVVIREGLKTALINREISGRGREAPFWVRVGDKIDRMTVVGIEPDRILVEEDGDRFEILLSDHQKEARPILKKKASGPTVISTGGKAHPSPAPEPGDQPAKTEDKKESSNNG